ncbi:MAG: papain-like cysteine protease family protein [Anaerolineales bacterium]
MKFLRALTVAALFAALFVLAFPAHADCGDSDPTCLLEPPISVEIRTDSSSGDASAMAADSGALTPLNFAVPMPLPRRVEAPSVSTQSEPESTDSIPDFTTLSIPMRYQTAGDVSCGVQALGMALDGIKGSAPTSNSILGFLQDQGMMYDFGTGVEELAHAAQNFGYAGSLPFHGWSLEQLSVTLAEGKPVVVALGANGEGEPGHFVTVTGVSADGKWVSYNDPTLGHQVISSEEFLHLWSLQGSSGVSVAEAIPAGAPNYTPWTALAAAMMATLALAPSMLSDVRRKGVGGMLIGKAGSGGTTTYVGMDPPYSAPEGMKWVKGEAMYETHTHTEIVYHEVAKKELQKVQVGTTTKKIPYTKRILVDNGRWVTDYKTERYIKGYRNKRILDGYRTRRYVKYYRTRLVRTRWGYTRRRTPVYGYKRVPVYRTLRVPIYGTRKVPNGRHWESKWEYEHYTEYKTVVKPVYEEQWVTVGYQRIPEVKIVEEQVTVGYQWTLEGVKDHLPIKPEIDILGEIGDIRASVLHPKLMVTTAPLRIRSSPSTESASLTIALDGAEILWTGRSQVLSSGATWYQVRYKDPIKGLVTGWVNSGYLETPVHIPEIATEVESNVDTSRNDAIGRWLHYFTPEERAAYIAAEKQRLEAFWSEIRRLTIPQGGLGGGIEGLFIRDEVGTLFKPPEWYTNGGMPDTFYQQHLLDEETLRVLQLILLNPESLTGEVTNRTWDTVSSAFHMSQEDLKIHVLGNTSWKPEPTTSVGSYPISLFVIRPHGHYLLVNPSPDSGNVSKNFLGVPGGEKVQWDGRYHLGVNDAGKDVVYYYVSWAFNGTTYSGWIPNKYLAPGVKSWDTGFTSSGEGTHGYGGGKDAWSKYYTGTGSAQNLDLSKIMKELGFEDYDLYANPHKNLCGWLATMEALGLSLEEGFEQIAKLYPEILQDGQAQTNSTHLTNFINSFSDNGWSATTGRLFEYLTRSIDSGNRVIALVALNGSNHFSTGEEDARKGHWIRIHSANNEVVTYYDSLTNSVKTIPLEMFNNAWKSAQFVPGNTSASANLFIEAFR